MSARGDSQFIHGGSDAFSMARGFTLVEVMVAMLVVAIAISALLFQMGGNIDNTAYLRDKSIAQWVALNQLEQMRIENRLSNQLPQQETTGTEEMAGQTWYWTVTPKKVAAEGFSKLEVRVATSEGGAAVVTVDGIVDVYHQL